MIALVVAIAAEDEHAIANGIVDADGAVASTGAVPPVVSWRCRTGFRPAKNPNVVALA